MKLVSLKTNPLNQNNYNRNALTPEFIGSLVIYPVDITPEKCLPCDGYKLKKADYAQLYAVIGNKYNDGKVGTQIAAGIPDHTHTVVALYWDSNGIVEEGRGNPDFGHQKTLTTSKASANNSIYGKSKTVQPPSQIVHICIRYK